MGRNDKYSPEVVKQKRKLPIKRIVGSVLILILQIIIVVFVCIYKPEAKDLITDYKIYIEPDFDGSVYLTYQLDWTALDDDDPLTWVEIGMPNHSYRIIESSINGPIAYYEKYSEGDYESIRFYLTNEYSGGDFFDFSFKVEVYDLICHVDKGYYIEYIPCWFNAIDVEKYTFYWKKSYDVLSTNCDATNSEYYIWKGSLKMGEYRKLYAYYDDYSFSEDMNSVKYEEFDDSKVYNQLKSDKQGIVVFGIFFIVLLTLYHIYTIDSFVSYNRGRGFIKDNGHYVNVYGRVNPKYRASHGNGGSSCACACACACAGGGRAGCSVKDGYSSNKFKKEI